jgi:heme/copper-type cytochrome/quinol oxidase subunit 2
MIATVRAVEPAEFKAWLATKKTEIQAADKLAEAERKTIADQASAGDQAP